MKKLISIAVIVIITSCDASVSTVDQSQKEKIANSLTYFKDTTTGLCFAAIGSGAVDRLAEANVSITCVPCDSLKNIHMQK